MGIFIFILCLAGLINRQGTKYWLCCALAVLVQGIAGFLFSGNGTLDKPYGDGLITQILRQRTLDGPQVLWMVFPTFLLGWFLPIFIAKSGFEKRVKSTSTDLNVVSTPKKYLVVFPVSVVAISILVTSFAFYSTNKRSRFAEGRARLSEPPSVEEMLIRAANESNRTLPMAVDASTRLDTTVAGPGKRLTYNYTLLPQSADRLTEAQLDAAMGKTIRSSVCANPSMHDEFLRHSVDIAYRYRRSDGSTIGEIVVRSSDCAALPQTK